MVVRRVEVEKWRLSRAKSAKSAKLDGGVFNVDRSTVKYALSRSMSPAMVAEYKRLMIPKDVLQETYDRYIGMGEAKGGVK